MIYKIKGRKNGYVLCDSSTGVDLMCLLKEYPERKCVICNKNTAKVLNVGPLTINNDLLDGVFYINGVY